MPKTHPRTEPARIVLAEDDRVIACLIEIALKRTGIPHTLEIAFDGAPAIAAVEARAPDLLLLDLNMPGKNGFEVLRHLKSHAELRRIPVVMLSNSEAAADIKQAYDLHVNAYVRKDTDFAEMCRMMDKIVQFWLETAVTSF